VEKFPREVSGVFLVAGGVLSAGILKCWSRCRFSFCRLLVVHSMAHSVQQSLALVFSDFEFHSILMSARTF